MGISLSMPESGLSLSQKKNDFVMPGSVDVVLIGCMMGQFCHTLHGKGCVPGKVLTRNNKGIGLYCQNNVLELCR